MRTFRTILHKLLKLNNLLTFHVEQLIGVSAFHVEHHNTGHLEHFPGVPIFSPKRRFSPVFSLFGDSAALVGRRSADPRVAPNNFPRSDRNVQTKRRKTLPPKRFAAESLYRRFDTSPKTLPPKRFTVVSAINRNFRTKFADFSGGKQGDGAAAHTDIRAAEKKIKMEKNYVCKNF